MKIPENRFKRALAERRLQIGLWSQLTTGISAEVLAGAGFDWLVIDTEHAPNDVASVLAQLQAMEGGTASAVVRVAWNDMVQIKRMLDIGAQTLLIPYVQTAQEAEQAVAFSRYPPLGVRGVATCHRANRYGRVHEYALRAADETCVLVQVETRLALDNIEAIAGVDGVDGLFFGPSDLAASMGHLGRPAHPEVQAAMIDGMRRCRDAGKPAGILTAVEADVRRFVEEGFVFVAVGSDIALLAREAETLAAKYRDAGDP